MRQPKPVVILAGFIIGLVIATFLGDAYDFAKAKIEKVTLLARVKNAYTELAQNNNRAALDAFAALEPDCVRLKDPKTYARVKTGQGVALFGLSEEKDEKLITQALTAFEAALGAYTETKFPESFASTQNNIGTARSALYRLRGKPEDRVAAVAAYAAALRVYTLDTFPEYHRSVQENLDRLEKTVL